MGIQYATGMSFLWSFGFGMENAMGGGLLTSPGRKSVGSLRFMAPTISLDLACKLKLKLNRQNQVKVSGLGGTPTQITASAEIKITLGSRVVYIMELWVANIGEGLDVLLGMDFIVDLPVTSPENLYLMPGEHAVVRIQYGHTNPEREGVWAGRGDRWCLDRYENPASQDRAVYFRRPDILFALERELFVNGKL
ncbi:hypothetical protein PHMEG_00028533 [Phytophthora megakarya]|uniref:Eukaryotic/viral aspartic protease n=1 Tax=Phytophthora megakarya TaxID=4795 RepID=A0A225V7A7_9STRA|nr:hypothetical protein PHMEG_00028533 [Phytophthora megakarya]